MANFVGARNLLEDQLGGANLRGARLPESLKGFVSLAKTDELAKSASTVFLSMLIVCAYVWITISATTDTQLLLPSAGKTKLPLIDAEIPIGRFFLLAPTLLFAIYIYFQLYLQRLWELMTTLPAVFPEGISLDKRSYSWLLTNLVRAHIARLSGSSLALLDLERRVSVFLAYWLVPLTIASCWLRYIPRHDGMGTAVHAALLVVAILAASGLYRLMARTLRARSEWQKGAFARRRLPMRRIVTAVAVSLLVGLLSIGAFEAPSVYFDPYPFLQQRLWPPKRWLYSALRWINSARFGNFAEAKLSIRPPTWNGKDITAVEGASFRRVRLPYANFEHAFLVNADFRGATLDGANFSFADMRGAKFLDVAYSRSEPASVEGVSFGQTNLDNADLSGLDLRTASFTSGTSLVGVVLESADLRDVSMPGVKMHGANLFHADLRGTVLNLVDLRGATLSATKMLGVHLYQADLTGNYISGVCLAKADLSEAKLARADLRGSNLSGANLRGADLRGAKLRGDRSAVGIFGKRDVIGLSRDQVRSAIVDATTQLPSDLEAHDRELTAPDTRTNDPCVEP